MSNLAEALTGEGTYATVLLTIFVETYGTEGFTWSPETIQMELEEDFNIRLPQANTDRLLTAINLLTSDDFYRSLPDFINYCNILSGDTYDPRSFDPADSVECAWGITEGLMLSPPDDNDDEPFSEEIVAYIGKVLDDEGIINPPDVLRIAVRDTDHSQAVSEFSDDPIMFNAIHDFETSKTEEINRVIKQHVQRMGAQLEALPLRVGETKGVVKKMLNSLGQPQNDSLI
jgi:hypothetical protein